MALNCKVGSFAEPAATGAQTISGVGFEPKALLVFSDAKRASSGADALARFTFGAGTGPSARVCAAIESRDGLANADANRMFSTTSIIEALSNGAVGEVASADLTALNGDGFEVTWSNVHDGPVARLYHYLALGGADLTNAKAGSFTASASTGNQAVTGVGFQPDCVLLFGVFLNSTGASVNAIFCLGGMTPTDQWAVCIDDEDNQATMDTERSQRTDRCYYQRFNGSLVQSATFVSMDSDGFTVLWGTASARLVGYLALKGGQFKLGAISQKTSTGTQGYTGVGFPPVGLLLASFGNTATTTAQANARLSLGAASGSTARGATWYGSSDAAADSVADSALSQTACLTMQTEGTPTEVARADLDSFDSNGFTFDWELADATAREIVYLAFGSAGGGGGAKPWLYRRHTHTLGAGFQRGAL